MHIVCIKFIYLNETFSYTKEYKFKDRAVSEIIDKNCSSILIFDRPYLISEMTYSARKWKR